MARKGRTAFCLRRRFYCVFFPSLQSAFRALFAVRQGIELVACVAAGRPPNPVRLGKTLGAMTLEVWAVLLFCLLLWHITCKVLRWDLFPVQNDE